MAAMAMIDSDKNAEVVFDHPALVESTMALGFPFLMFPAVLEDRFLQHGQDQRFAIVLAAGLISIVLFGGLVIADLMVMPDVVLLGLVLRVGVYGPLTLGGLYVLHQLRIARLTEWVVVSGGILAATLSAIIFITSTSQWAFCMVVELNLVIIFICAFARFWPAVVLSIFTALTHAFVITMVHDFTGILSANTSLLLAITIGFTLYGNYKLEHDERMAFLMDLHEKTLNAENMAARDRLASMATTDSLTNVANRRYFDDFLGECLKEAQSQGSALSLAIIDIDHFKLYNDHHGHQAGDRCLIAVAQALNACTRRPGDVVARWGGEEFAVVMTDADADAAAAAGERIRRAVHGLALKNTASPSAPVVTVSVGLVSAMPGPGTRTDDLLQRADAALYQAKADGRNRVVQDIDAAGMWPKEQST